jgi:hypothetical protein
MCSCAFRGGESVERGVQRAVTALKQHCLLWNRCPKIKGYGQTQAGDEPNRFIPCVPLKVLHGSDHYIKA